MSDNIIIGISILAGIIAALYCIYRNRCLEGYTAPNPDDAPGKYGISAPWIPKKTPVPISAVLDATAETSQILEDSADPGAHIVCAEECKKKQNEHANEPDYMQVCIDICMQSKWTQSSR